MGQQFSGLRGKSLRKNRISHSREFSLLDLSGFYLDVVCRATTVFRGVFYLGKGVSMFSFYSLKRNWARSVFALLAVAFLLTTLLFTGCKTDDDEEDFKLAGNSPLIGSWIAGPNWGSYDGYVITANKLSYVSGTDSADLSVKYCGTIKHVEKFSDTSGVIIMSYDAGFENEYYENWVQDPPDSGNWVGVDPYPLNGNFIGIYYRSLNAGTSVEMGTAYLNNDEGLPVAEQATLNAAIAAYTKERGIPKGEANCPDNSFISSYGAYNKQP